MKKQVKNAKKVNELGAVQGDVLILRVTEIPPSAEIVKSQAVTVALGEATGHKHVVNGVAEAREDLSGWYFVVPDGKTATLDHTLADGRTLTNDHDTIEMSPGLYFIPRVSQVEYDGAQERRVAD